jgi:preprotein translocase subunit SecA
MNVLRGVNVHEQVLKFIPDYVAETISSAVNIDAMPELWNEDELNQALEAKVLPEGTNYVTRERLMKWDYETALRKISNKVVKEYEKKIAELAEQGVDFSSVERRVLLMTVDRNWIDHIDAMDQLRKGISLRAYGQVDPIISYKKEGFDMFDEMVERIQRTTISVLLKVRVEMRPAPMAAPASAPNRPFRRQMPEMPKMQPAPESAPAQEATPTERPRAFRRQMPEPITNMASFKEIQARVKEVKEQMENQHVEPTTVPAPEEEKDN